MRREERQRERERESDTEREREREREREIERARPTSLKGNLVSLTYATAAQLKFEITDSRCVISRIARESVSSLNILQYIIYQI